MKKASPRAHWEIVKINNGADKYCMKEETRVEGPFEFGVTKIRTADKKSLKTVKELLDACNG